MEFIIGLLIGSVLGLTGAGGSIFAVPLLVLLMRMETTEAMGLALAAVAVSAAIGTYRQRREVCWQYVLPLVAGGVIAAPLGQWVSLFVNETILVIGFSGIALTIAIRMLQQANSNPNVSLHLRASRLRKTSQALASQSTRYIWSRFVFGGFMVGFASGLFGVGGGFLIVPLLTWWGKFSMPQAIASSLASIVFISGIGFVSHYLISDFTNVDILVKLLSAAIVGMLLSQRLSRSISGANLQKIFSILLMMVSIVLVLERIIL